MPKYRFHTPRTEIIYDVPAEFSQAALEFIQETSSNPKDDLRDLRKGTKTAKALLKECLNWAAPDRIEGIKDYVYALEWAIEGKKYKASLKREIARKKKKKG